MEADDNYGDPMMDDVGDEDYEDKDAGETKRDGLADMMSKILNQKIGDKIPVLAKRKTALMKDADGQHGDAEKMKKLRLERKAEKEKQLVVPDHTSADFERQLRKLATRGVVALFNAVAKSKKEAAEKEESENNKNKGEGEP